ncbi:mandelate racemase/muconate lactonizing enzyme family protein [Stackebrandtia nassauensis]|uniref:glucarate dehydratase n=1 Tax=Stackebrandtia nassauensis (strain DSM 44728 / CIP 108903 / NRRL B-16338 / NBRC 102104 / LLR-40K-21) TaxID=446470 RepID=D3PUH4_STANL|nr:mandelate racemase/muconate lactonizing enzyme family protein [Stackebrandtia nassauensis]ADD42987.1 Mandelate racemase/muconate lactonizing protein [Stackebrandtia nassauensis DSM 44728]
MIIDGIDVWVVNVPYRSAFVSSFEVRRGTTRTVVRLRTDTGLVGWGETMHGDPVAALTRKLFDTYRGRSPYDVEAVAAELAMVPFFYGYLGYAALAGLEMACHDLMAKAAGQPLHRLIGGGMTDRIALTYVLTPPEDTGAATADAIADEAADAVTRGYRALKLKGSHDPAIDLGYLEAIRERLPDLALRVDPNGHWPLARTLQYARRIEELRLEYLEDPCPDLATMAQVRERVRVPLCTNMCVVRFEDVVPAIELGAVDVVHGDVFKWGGIAPTKRLAGICATTGWGMNLHSGGELGLATAAHLQVAAATPQISYPIDTVYYLFEDDILSSTLPIVDGELAVPDGPGLGVEPDLDKLAHFASLHSEQGDLLL